MVEISAFTGLRFATHRGPQFELERVTAPPYDAIDSDLAAELRSRSPYNIVRLELASASGDSERDPYEDAAATYRRWRRDGVLERDSQPTVRVYEQGYELPDGRPARQLGVLAALGLEPFDDGAVLPHEHIFRAPVEDRLRLLEALPVNLSPVYVVTEDHVPAARDVLEDVAATADPEQFVDENGVVHRIWTVADRSVHSTLARGLRASRVLMADGHHRYTTALEHAAAHGTAGAILALVAIPGSVPGTRAPEDDDRVHDAPCIHAMHRVLTSWPSDAEQRLTAHGYAVAPVRHDVAALERTIASAGDRSFGIVTGDTALLVRPPPPRSCSGAGKEDLLAGLPSVVVDDALHEAVDIEPRSDVTYLADSARVSARLAAGDAQAVALVRPLAVEEVWRVARAGARMPPKSTAFFPKPRTGIVLRPLRDPPS